MEQSKKFGLRAQEEALRQYAVEQQFEVVRVYADQCSGMHWQGQKELMGLIAGIERGEFDVVAVTERDRLTRDPDGSSILKYIFAKKGVRLAVVTEPALRSKNPSEELIDGIISLIARYESQIRLVRVRRGMDLAVKSGKHPGKAPLGYVNAADGLKIDPEAAALVRRIFREHAESGLQRRPKPAYHVRGRQLQATLASLVRWLSMAENALHVAGTSASGMRR